MYVCGVNQQHQVSFKGAYGPISCQQVNSYRDLMSVDFKDVSEKSLKKEVGRSYRVLNLLLEAKNVPIGFGGSVPDFMMPLTLTNETALKFENSNFEDKKQFLYELYKGLFVFNDDLKVKTIPTKFDECG